MHSPILMVCLYIAVTANPPYKDPAASYGRVAFTFFHHPLYTQELEFVGFRIVMLHGYGHRLHHAYCALAFIGGRGDFRLPYGKHLWLATSFCPGPTVASQVYRTDSAQLLLAAGIY
jgi:hypothetical protein